jgi:hypothetical protein
MEARTAFRGSAVSKNVVAIVAAVLVALVLGALAGYLFKALSLAAGTPSAQVAAVHPSYAVGPATREPAGSGFACTTLATYHSTKHAIGTHGPTQGAQHAGH